MKIENKQITMTVCQEIAFMLVQGFSDTLTEEQQQTFHGYMDSLKEQIPYDHFVVGEIDDKPDNWTRCEVLGDACEAWEVPLTLVKVTL